MVGGGYGGVLACARLLVDLEVVVGRLVEGRIGRVLGLHVDLMVVMIRLSECLIVVRVLGHSVRLRLEFGQEGVLERRRGCAEGAWCLRLGFGLGVNGLRWFGKVRLGVIDRWRLIAWAAFVLVCCGERRAELDLLDHLLIEAGISVHQRRAIGVLFTSQSSKSAIEEVAFWLGLTQRNSTLRLGNLNRRQLLLLEVNLPRRACSANRLLIIQIRRRFTKTPSPTPAWRTPAP